MPVIARAEVWGYLDDQGLAHFAPQKLDERYQLFFKGDTVPERDDAAQRASPSPGDALPEGAPALSESLQRLVHDQNASRYQALIEQHAARQDVDPALVKAIVAVESGFQARAVSPKGARGLMQVTPETAARYGVTGDRKGSAEQKLLDPGVSLRVGIRYLRDLLARFAGDIALTLAAYNAGEMAVERYQNRVPPYPETVAYVKRVQQLYQAFRPVAQATPGIPARSAAGVLTKRIRGTLLARPAWAEMATLPAL